jgi:hypothetical protein
MQTGPNKKDHRKKGKGSTDGPPGDQPVHAEQGSGKPSNEQSDSNGKPWSLPDRLGLFFDGVVAFVTVVGVVFLVLQWRQTERGLETAREANAQTVQAFRTDVRAWVLARSVSANLTDCSVSGEVVLVNSGRSPAIAVRSIALMSISKLGAMGPPPTGEPEAIAIPAGQPLPPSDPLRRTFNMGASTETTLTIEGRFTIPATHRFAYYEDCAALRTFRATVFAHGIANYADIFGTQHVTHYCFVSRPKAAGVLVFEPCESGNRVQ